MPQPDNTDDEELESGQRALPRGPIRAALTPGESTTGRLVRAGRVARSVARGIRNIAAARRRAREGRAQR